VQSELIHWRPEGWQLLACGALHVPEPKPRRGLICCRRNITEVTCPDCLRVFGRATRSSGSETFPGPAGAAGNGPAAEVATSASAPSAGAHGTAAADPVQGMADAIQNLPEIELRLFHSDRRRNGLYVDGRKSDLMHIWVSGDPAPQGSVKAFAIKKGKGKDAHYTGKVGIASASPAHGSWRNDVVIAAAKELYKADLAMADLPLFGAEQPCSVELRFYLPRPKSHFGTGGNAGKVKPQFATAWPMVKDFDKLTRTILDALQLAGVVADDKQFVGSPGIWRVFADYCVPGADIWVEPAPPGIPALTLMPGLRWRAEPRPPVDFRTGGMLVTGEEGS